MEIYDSEFNFWIYVFMVIGVAVIIWYIRSYFRMRKQQRENKQAQRIAEREEKERHSEYHLRRFARETYAELHELQRKKNCGGSRNIRVVGYHGHEYETLTDGYKSAIASGRFAAVKKIK